MLPTFHIKSSFTSYANFFLKQDPNKQKFFRLFLAHARMFQEKNRKEKYDWKGHHNFIFIPVLEITCCKNGINLIFVVAFQCHWYFLSTLAIY